MPKSTVQPSAKEGDARCKFCGRKALWKLYDREFMCNPDFQAWTKTHDFDPFDIERLSDDDRDFDRVVNARDRIPVMPLTQLVQ